MLLCGEGGERWGRRGPLAGRLCVFRGVLLGSPGVMGPSKPTEASIAEGPVGVPRGVRGGGWRVGSKVPSGSLHFSAHALYRRPCGGGGSITPCGMAGAAQLTCLAGSAY